MEQKVLSGADEAKQFLEALYGEEELESGHLVCYTLPERKSTWFWNHDREAFVRRAIDLAKSTNVYVGLGLQNKKKAMENASNETVVRGKKESVVAIPGVWLDIDVKGPAHKATDLPETFEEAQKIIDSFPLQPTMLVNSGHGYQVYWLFKEPWLFESEEERAEAQEFVDRFLKTMQHHAAQYGWKVDATSDISRVYRVPGTWNRKGSEPAPVHLEYIHDGNRYTRDDLEQYFIEVTPEENTSKSFKFNSQSPSIKTIPNFNQFAKIEHIESNCAWMKHCKEDAKTLSEPEWYAVLSILGRCQNGEELAHEWSKPYPNYSYEETQNKLYHAINDAGPATCEQIQKITGKNWCKECVQCHKVTSPIEISQIIEMEMQLEGARKTVSEKIEQIKTANVRVPLTSEEKGALKFIKKHDPSTHEQYSTELNLALSNTENKTQKITKAPSHLRAVEANEQPSPKTVGSLLENAPLENLIVPADYHLSETGIQKVSYRSKQPFLETIALAPVLLTGLMEDVQTHQEMVRITYLRGTKWKNKIVNRDIIASARKVVELANEGFPVTTGNASELVKYISVMEAENYKQLPKQLVSSQLGWQGKKLDKGFLWGKTTITENGLNEHKDFDESSTNGENVIFRGTDAGDEQIASGLQSAGSMEKWMEAVALASEYPKAMIAFYSAFVAPLLEILGCSNFIIDFANRTSTGKTTVQRIAASVVGNPDEKQANSILGSWDATKVWFERASSVMTGLPVLLDDTKRAKKPKDVAEFLYMVANGRGRARGNLKSINRTNTWRTVLISSGETPATQFTNDGGTRARVLEIRGIPFEGDSDDVRKLVQTINQMVCQNYGHAFPIFVQWIQKNRDKWGSWKEDFHEMTDLLSRCVKSNVAGRLASYGAAIDITAELVHQAFDEMGHPLPFNYDGCVKFLWPYIAEETSDATGEEQALRDIVSWAYSRETHFYERHQDFGGGPVVPSQGWLGKWEKGDWKILAIYPNVLKNELEKMGLNSKEVLSLWNDRGWLETTPGRPGFTKSLRVNGKDPKWVIAIKREAIESLE